MSFQTTHLAFTEDIQMSVFWSITSRVIFQSTSTLVGKAVAQVVQQSSSDQVAQIAPKGKAIGVWVYVSE